MSVVVKVSQNKAVMRVSEDNVQEAIENHRYWHQLSEACLQLVSTFLEKTKPAVKTFGDTLRRHCQEIAVLDQFLGALERYSFASRSRTDNSPWTIVPIVAMAITYLTNTQKESIVFAVFDRFSETPELLSELEKNQDAGVGGMCALLEVQFVATIVTI